MHIQYAMAFVSDMPKATAFYRERRAMPRPAAAWADGGGGVSCFRVASCGVGACP